MRAAPRMEFAPQMYRLCFYILFWHPSISLSLATLTHAVPRPMRVESKFMQTRVTCSVCVAGQQVYLPQMKTETCKGCRHWGLCTPGSPYCIPRTCTAQSSRCHVRISPDIFRIQPCASFSPARTPQCEETTERLFGRFSGTTPTS